MASEVKANKLSPSSGTALQIGDASDTITIPTGATLTVVDGVPVASGGTGLASFTAGDILYATGSTTLAKLGKGTGLQGLQTNSGATAPQWANSPQSLMTAAGDILYASGANTLAKLAKGSNDEVLTLAAGVPSWAATAGGGKILQVVHATDATARANSSPSWSMASNTLSCAITPSATSSKIAFGFAVSVYSAGDFGITVFRDSTNLGENSIGNGMSRLVGKSTWGGQLVDSPSSTSEITYSVQTNAIDSQATTTGYNSSNGYTVAMEIDGS